MASKSGILSIVAWSLVVVLLVCAGAMGIMSQKETARADGLRDALLQVGTSAGVAELTSESLEGNEALPNTVQQLEGAILGDKQELISTKDALTAAQEQVSSAQAEITKLSEGTEEHKSKADSLSKELAAKSEQLDEAKAQAEKAEKALAKAKKSADKKAKKLSAKLDDVKAEMAEETARLQGDLDAALQQLSAQDSVGESGVSEEVAMAADGEVAVEEAVIEAEPEMAVEEVVEEVVIEPGRIIGQSEMFSLIRYSAASGALFLRFQDGQTLNYQDVPEDVVEDMLTSEAKLDMKYRFNIQGNYKSLPPDGVVVRKYWKNERYRPQSQDVRLIEDAPLPEVVVEEAVIVEEKAAEEVVVEEAVVEEVVEEE